MKIRTGHDFHTGDGVPFVVREAVSDDAEQLLAVAHAVIDERLEGIIFQPDEMKGSNDASS